MSRTSQDVLLFLFGLIMLRVGASDLHLRFVKPGMQPLIVLSAVVLLVLVALSLLQQASRPSAHRPTQRIFTPTPRPQEDEHAGHGHEHGAPRTAWLLALPLLVLLLVAPPPLGADAVRRSVSSAPPAVGQEELTALPAAREDGVRELSLGEYGNRARVAPATLAGAPVRLVGFVVHDEQGWLLARLTLSCCAADGRPVVVRIGGPAALPVPEQDSWVEVVGSYAAGGPDGVPALAASSTRGVPEPSSPYESR